MPAIRPITPAGVVVTADDGFLIAVARNQVVRKVSAGLAPGLRAAANTGWQSHTRLTAPVRGGSLAASVLPWARSLGFGRQERGSVFSSETDHTTW
jgi:hypothetical protein